MGRRQVLDNTCMSVSDKQQYTAWIAAGHNEIVERQLPEDLASALRGWRRLAWLAASGADAVYAHQAGLELGDQAAELSRCPYLFRFHQNSQRAGGRRLCYHGSLQGDGLDPPPPPQMWSRCFVHAKCRLLFLTIASYELRHSFLTKRPHHFGLTRQYAEAKTEAILALCGKGRQPAFERLVATEDPKIKVPTIAIGPGTALRIAPRNHQVGAIVVFKAQVPNIPHIGALSLPREKGH